jgi:hypothetical protein
MVAKVTLLLGGNAAIVSPEVKKLVLVVDTGVPSGNRLLGHEASGVPVVATHVIVVQIRPDEYTSLTTAPLAGDGPRLLKVMV